jgi:hypothetical protein
MTAEENWRLNGPDWLNRDEVLIYSDWLEEQGDLVPAQIVRWMLWREHRPMKFGEFLTRSNPVWSWWNRDEGRVRTQIASFPEAIWQTLTGHIPVEENYTNVKDYTSPQDAMNDVVRAARLHPDLFQREILNASNDSPVAGPVAG